MDSNPEPADIAFTATVKADQLRFREVPRVDIHFSGVPDHQSATTSRRTNLPDPVAANVDYHDVRVDYLLTNSRQAADEARLEHPRELLSHETRPRDVGCHRVTYPGPAG